jgi:hypothetical protein
MKHKKDIQYAMRLPAPQRYKVMHAILNRAEKPARKQKIIRKKRINPKHLFIQELLQLGLKPKQIASLQQKHVSLEKNVIVLEGKVFPLSETLKQKFKEHCDFSTRILLRTNRGTKYTTRTIQEIRKFVRKDSSSR